MIYFGHKSDKYEFRTGFYIIELIILLRGRGVKLNPHPLLVPRSKSRVELYLYSP
jgi:hypothetical protein